MFYSTIQETETTKMISIWNPSEGRIKGRPKIRWQDEVENDLRNMNVNNWKEKAYTPHRVNQIQMKSH